MKRTFFLILLFFCALFVKAAQLQISVAYFCSIGLYFLV